MTDQMPIHDLGCRCYPHVSEKDALAQIERVALAEYRSARSVPTRPDPYDLRTDEEMNDPRNLRHVLAALATAREEATK